MTAPAIVSNWIRASFGPTAVKSVEEATVDVLVANGLGRFEAESRALEMADDVLRFLRSDPSQNLTFAFARSDDRRLVGKARVRANDPEVVGRVRSRIPELAAVMAAVAALHPCDFERLCAALMRTLGAVTAVGGCASGDGGIDVYGRLPIRRYPVGLPQGLLRPLFLEQRPLLFFGQCKSVGVNGSVGRPALAQFSRDVTSCIRKYPGAKKLPPHRVPSDFYRRGEPVIGIFFTTGVFSEDASASDVALDQTLVEGIDVAETLLFHSIGFVDSTDGPVISVDRLQEFANA